MNWFLDQGEQSEERTDKAVTSGEGGRYWPDGWGYVCLKKVPRSLLAAQVPQQGEDVVSIIREMPNEVNILTLAG